MNVGISILILIGLHSCKTSKKDISYLKESIEPPSTFIATKSDYQTNPVEPNSIIMGYLIDGYILMISLKTYLTLEYLSCVLTI